MATIQERHRGIEEMLSEQINQLKDMYDAKEVQIEELNKNMRDQVDHMLNQKHSLTSEKEELEQVIATYRREVKDKNELIDRQYLQLEEVRVCGREEHENGAFTRGHEEGTKLGMLY